MATSISEKRYELERAEVIMLRVAAGTTIACRAGLVWITQAGQRDDYWLPTGEVLRVAHSTRIVIEAAQRSGVVLTRAAARATLASIAARLADAVRRLAATPAQRRCA